MEWGRCTAKGSKLYLHIFNWPRDGELVVPDVKSRVKAAYLLADVKRKALEVTRLEGEKVRIDMDTIDLDPGALNPSDTVLALELK